MNYLLVFIGGGFGCITRLFISNTLPRITAFPMATFISNVLSSLLLGLLLGYLVPKNPGHENLRLLLAVGFCGGFSTFSTFSFETFTLISSGNLRDAFISITLNLAICYLAVAAGYWAIKNL